MVGYSPSSEMIKMGMKVKNGQGFIPIGALEVYFMGVLLYSKEKSKIWPNTTSLSIKCLQCYNDYVLGNSIMHYWAIYQVKR